MKSGAGDSAEAEERQNCQQPSVGWLCQVKADGVHCTDYKRFQMLEIDENGLDEMDKRILETIVLKFSGGPAGINSLLLSESLIRLKRCMSLPDNGRLYKPHTTGTCRHRIVPKMAKAFDEQEICLIWLSCKLLIFHRQNGCYCVSGK